LEGDASIIARYPAPIGEAISCCVMGVAMIPGLIELTRAPRSPHVSLAAGTRRWFARLEIPEAMPEIGDRRWPEKRQLQQFVGRRSR
jgi:hypothetical protein